MNLCDIDLGLGGLDTFDLRSLGQPSQIQEHDSCDDNDDDAKSDGDGSEDDTKSDPNFEEGQINDEDDSDDDDVSLTHKQWSTDSEDSDLAGIPVDANVPQLSLDAFHIDDDGRESRNPFGRMYRTGEMWARVEMKK